MSVSKVKDTPTPFSAVLIGAGNIGSRHAQALMRLEKDIHLTVFDVSTDSLATCKTRIEEIDRGAYQAKVDYITTFDLLPTHTQFAIIATSSEHRLNALENLTARCQADCIILEKFLFSSEDEYEKAALILQQQENTLAYVNCVKRQFQAYRFVKEKLGAIEGDGKINAEIKGNNWGLAGNAVHYIDLFYYLTGSIPENVELPNVSYAEIIESKRIGYIELLGSCNVITKNGDTLSVSSTPGTYDKIECVVEKDGRQFKVVELGSTIEVFIGEEKTIFEYPFQSLLTKLYAEEFLATGKISLTSYEIAADYHLKFLNAAKKFTANRNYTKAWKIT